MISTIISKAAIVGFGAGCATSILTMPLDNTNTRIKSGELAHFSITDAHLAIIKKDGAMALFRGVLPRTATIGLGSTFFWYWNAKISEMIEVSS